MPASSHRQRRILIIDDASEEIQRVQQLLQEYDVDALVQPDPHQAATLCRQDHFNLIVSERLFPEHPDVDITELLRAQSYGGPLLIITREPDLDERLKHLALEIDDYITKPFHPEEVAARIDAVLQETDLIADAHSDKNHSFFGRLEEMNLMDLLHTLDVGKKSGVITMIQNHDEATVLFRNSEVIDARLADLEAETALLRLLMWNNGDFRVALRSLADQNAQLHITKQALASLNNQLQEHRRALADWLPDLKTTVVATPSALEATELDEVELGWVRHLQQPFAIETLLDHMDTAVQSLQTIHHLFSLGYLQTLAAAGEQPGWGDALQQAKNKNGDRYGRLASFFKRSLKKKVTPNRGNLKSIPDESLASSPERRSLGRAELLLIRQKFQ
jgi:DNA-binding response OmpR family regulator